MAELVFAGGLNEQDVATVRPEECIEGYNFELGFSNTSLSPRAPVDSIATATNTSEIRGIIQLIKQDQTETTLIQAGTALYDWDGTTTFTSKATVNSNSKLRGTTWELGDYSVITDINKNEVVKKWDGSTVTTLTTGVTDDVYAKYSIVYLNRMWLFNVKAGTDTPHLMVASEFENPESYDVAKRAGDSSFTTGQEAFYMTSPDLLPINGAEVWGNDLIISTENGRLWKLTGSDSTDFAWIPFYAGSASVGTETVKNIGNDLVYMKRDGVIESLKATETYGDVAADDLSKFIRVTTSGLSDCITQYDQSRQKVYMFAGANKLLVLFKDLIGSELSPWSVYRTALNGSFSTEAALYIREPGGTAASDWHVYFGDDSGNIRRLDGTGTGGDGGSENIETYRKTRLLEELQAEDGRPIDPRRDILRGRVWYRRLFELNLLMDFEWADDYAINRCTVMLDGESDEGSNYYNGSAYYGGNFYYSEGFQLSYRTSTKGYSAIGRGPGFYLATSVSSTKSFDILKIEL
jgi:hypothetical protein